MGMKSQYHRPVLPLPMLYMPCEPGQLTSWALQVVLGMLDDFGLLSDAIEFHVGLGIRCTSIIENLNSHLLTELRSSWIGERLYRRETVVSSHTLLHILKLCILFKVEICGGWGDAIPPQISEGGL